MPLEPPGNSTAVNGTYVPVIGTFFLGWDTEMARHQYIRTSGSPVGGENSTVTLIAKQTIEAIKTNSSAGVMAIISQSQANPNNKTCVCVPGDAGVMHTDAFADKDPYDPLDLPASEGGLDFLGRVEVQLETMDTPLIVDHYMKAFFHLIVGADKKSPTYGLPVMLYAGFGNRFIYSDWKLGDPAKSKPELWDLPENTFCKLISPECKDLFNA